MVLILSIFGGLLIGGLFGAVITSIYDFRELKQLRSRAARAERTLRRANEDLMFWRYTPRGASSNMMVAWENYSKGKKV